ncbi:MAG: HEAT repeat domain-containing protein [Candidatus Riflebacteria bacterium]|nr:HEAT repeat domain-containing protein [Candidatus Riflebacteria bacterium]
MSTDNLKIENVTEQIFSHFTSIDTTEFRSAFNELSKKFDFRTLSFLCDKFCCNTGNIQKRILALIESNIAKITPEGLNEILNIYSVAWKDNAECFLKIFSSFSEKYLPTITAFIGANENKVEIQLIQRALDESGLVDREINKWLNSPYTHKIVNLEKLIGIRHPKTYPHILNILKKETSRNEEKKLLQSKLFDVLKNVRNVQLSDFVLEHIEEIDNQAIPGVIGAFRSYGDDFFTKLYESSKKLDETILSRIAESLGEIADFRLSRFAFELLADKSTKVRTLAAVAIEKIAKKLCDEIDPVLCNPDMKNNIREKVNYFKNPLLEYLKRSRKAALNLSIAVELLFKLGRIEEEVFGECFPFLLDHAELSLFTYLKALDGLERKKKIVLCWNSEKSDNTEAILKFLKQHDNDNAIRDVFEQLFVSDLEKLPDAGIEPFVEYMYNTRGKDLMIQALNNLDEKTCCKLLSYISRIANFSVLPIFFSKKHDSSPVVRASVLKGLERFAYKFDEVDENLSDFIMDSNPRIALEAIKIAKNGNHPSFIIKLNKLLTSNVDQSIRLTAFNTMTYITRRKLFTNFDMISLRNRRSIALTLMKSDATFLNDLFQDYLFGDPEKKRMAIKVLSLIWDQITIHSDIDIPSSIADGDPFIRATFAKILTQTSRLEDKKYLFNLLNDTDNRVIANAIEGLANAREIINDDVISRMQSLVVNGNNRLRANSLITLWKLGMQNLDYYLLEMLSNSNKLFQTSGIYALGEIKEAKFLPVLIKYLRNNDADFRRNAVVSLGKYSEFPNVAEYVKRLANDPDEKVQLAVSEVLATTQSINVS